MILARPLVAFLVPALVCVGGLLLLVYYCESPRSSSYRRVLNWTLASFVLHLLIGAAITQSDVSATFFGSDASFYDHAAARLADHWEGMVAAPPLPPGKEGFFYLLGSLYYLFGRYVVAGLVVNAAFSAALVPLVFDTTRRLFGPDAARRVVPLVVLLPGFLVWTSQLLREAGILFFIALAANSAVRLTERFKLGPLVALALSLAGLFSFRGNVAFMVTAGVLAGLVIGRRGVVPGIGTGASVLVLLAVLVAVVGVGYAGYRLSLDADLEQVNVARTDSSDSAASGFNQETDVSTTERALSYLPVGAAQFLFGPFPWQVENERQLLGLLEVIVLWVFIPVLWRGLRTGWRDAGRRTAVLLFPAVLITVMLALLIGNFGTVTRERLQVVVLLLPFVALGMSERARRRARPTAQVTARAA